MIYIKINNCFSYLNINQTIELIEKIQYNFEDFYKKLFELDFEFESDDYDIKRKNLDFKKDYKFLFDNLKFYFKIKKRENKDLNTKNKKDDYLFDNENNNNNTNKSFSSSENENDNDNYNNNIDIKSIYEIEYNDYNDNINVSSNLFNFIFPIDYIYEKINELKKIEFIINIKVCDDKMYENFFPNFNNKKRENEENEKNEKNEVNINKGKKRNLSILFDNNNNRTSIQNKNSIIESSNKNFYNENKPIINLYENENQHQNQNQKNDNRNFLEIYKEILIVLNIKKIYIKNKKDKKEGESQFCIKIKEDSNWINLGKNKIIENFSENDIDNNNDKNVIIRLLPLKDGYLKLPEIEFFEISGNEEEELDNINEEFIYSKKSFNHMDFKGLGKSSRFLITGNMKNLKINPVNQLSLKLTVI
jgi:hypothetical protein